MIGRTLSHYRIEDKIGAGGMGEVYKAHDDRLDRDVAVKVLPAGTLYDEHARKRFRKEAQALSKLNHPNIATVHDFDTQDGIDFIVMELVEGVALSEKLKTGALNEKEVASLGAQIADALEEARERGIVHRDLKPGNVAVTTKGRVKILDFGLARMLRPLGDEATTEAMTEELSVAGTLPYMSPEELKGERGDHRSDLYSFGVVLYEMATGKRPFEEKLSTALTAAIVQKPPAPPSAHNRKVSPGLESIILKALDKDPDHRYQSAREMRVDLERLSASVSVAHKRKPIRSRRWLWAAAGVVAVMAILFALNAGGVRDRLLVEPGPRIDSIAVLPLENLSGDPEQDYFSDGMTEALISELGKIEALRVISRTSAMMYKEVRRPLSQIARELNVDAVVEGSVARSDRRIRVTTQLVQAVPEQQLWSESYERELEDILTLQGEVARSVAREIEVTVTPVEETRLGAALPVNPEAHEAYLKGRYHLSLRTAENRRLSVEFFREAIQKDPSSALAYAGLSRAYVMLALAGLSPSLEVFPKAKAAVKRAIEIDDQLAEAHVSMARIKHIFDYDWNGAERDFERSINLNPNLGDAHHFYAVFLSLMGESDRAIRHMKLALTLDPLTPMTHARLGQIYLHVRQYDLAIDHLQKTLEISPDLAWAHSVLGRAYLQKGMTAEAVSEFRKAHETGGGSLLWRFS